MTNRAPTFVCPICLTPRRTLGAVLSCHGEELRRVTGRLETFNTTLSLGNLLTNNYSPTTRLRLLSDAGVMDADSQSPPTPILTGNPTRKSA